MCETLKGNINHTGEKKGKIIMNNNAQNQLMEEIAEELNEEFRSMVIANVTQKGNLHIALKTRKHFEEYEVEEMLRGVLDYASEKFNVDFSIKNFYQSAIIAEVFEY